ncbi:MAG: hypothetical protein LBE67_16950 [Kocuria palustris]|nr:hypothetical protein [Kocuria palustris]
MSAQREGEMPTAGCRSLPVRARPAPGRRCGVLEPLTCSDAARTRSGSGVGIRRRAGRPRSAP